MIRNGIGINEHGCVEMTGIKAMWSLKRVLVSVMIWDGVIYRGFNRLHLLFYH